MNNGKPNALEGLDDYLAGIYETLKRQEEMLHELSLDTIALVRTLRLSEELSANFDRERSQWSAELSEKHAAQLRLLDEIIARLRGT